MCKHIWTSKSRSKSKINIRQLYKDWSIHKQTYKELSIKYKISKRTVQKYLDIECFKKPIIEAKEIILLIDTTYFGHIWLMVFKDKESKKVLHHRIVGYETNEEYKQWVYEIQKEWWIIKAIVCDGRRWLLWWFGDIPTQMCHFHQIQIVRRYITKKPVLQANKDLKFIVDRLHRTEKEWLKLELERWYKKHEWFIKEKWVSSTWKKYYIHRKTRSAYFSLKRNLEYLFVYHDYLWTLDIPNTTNWLEWMFWHMKYKVTLHRWLREDRKLKLIEYLLHSR